MVAIAPVKSEAAEHVAAAFMERLTLSQRQQVRHLASDTPSAKLLFAMKEVFPGLCSMELDACHLVMVYEASARQARVMWK